MPPLNPMMLQALLQAQLGNRMMPTPPMPPLPGFTPAPQLPRQPGFPVTQEPTIDTGYSLAPQPIPQPGYTPSFSGPQTESFPVHENLPTVYKSVPWRSKLEDVLNAKLPENASVEQALGVIHKGGVKKSEIEASKVYDYLRKVDKVDKKDLLGYVKANTPKIEVVEKGKSYKLGFDEIVGDLTDRLNSGDITQTQYDIKYRELKDRMEQVQLPKSSDKTKYSQHQLPGGENYREVLIKAPPLQLSPREMERYETLKTRQKAKMLTYETKNELEKMEDKLAFKSSHWDEPNVLAHLRANDRVTPDGKKVLFIEELQSDWAREGRAEGFEKAPMTQEEIKRYNELILKRNKLSNSTSIRAVTPQNAWIQKRDLDELDRVIDEMEELKRAGVPSHPLLKNWQELSLKQAIKEAVEGGYDYISWTTGEQQAERYDLSKQVDSIEYVKKQNGKIELEIFIKDAGSGEVIKSERRIADTNSIANIIGKEPAQKIIESSKYSGTLSGVDLKIGGEWAKNLYDRQIPNILKDLTKGEVGSIDISGKFKMEGLQQKLNEIDRKIAGMANAPRSLWNQRDAIYDKLQQAKKEGRIEKEKLSQPALKITPEMREKIKKMGLDLFSKSFKPSPYQAGKFKMVKQRTPHYATA